MTPFRSGSRDIHLRRATRFVRREPETLVLEVSEGEVDYLEAGVDSKGEEEEDSGVGAIKKVEVENSEVVVIH